MAWSFPTFFSFMSLPFGTPATSEGPAQFAYSGKSLDFANTGKIVIVMLSGFKHRQVLCSNPLVACVNLLRLTFFPWYCLQLLHASYVSSVKSNSSEPTRLLCPWDSPGKNTGVDAMPSSRDQTHLSLPPVLSAEFFTTSTTWEVPKENKC